MAIRNEARIVLMTARFIRRHKDMQKIRIVLSGGLALALSAISVLCCYLFGTHLAPGNERLIYGVLGGTADALKAVLPIAITSALASGQRGRAVVGCILFLTFSAYSFASELGLYALSRDAAASTTHAGAEQYSLLKDERARVRDRLQALGQTRPPKAIEADIAGSKQNRLWGVSGQCADASTGPSRTFCAGLERLRAELATAEEAEALRAKDEALATRLAGVNLADALRSADPQSEALARLTGFAPSSIKDALAILVAILIELGSGLGLFAATAGVGGTDSKGGSGSGNTAQGNMPPVGLPVASGKRSITCADGRPAARRDTRDPVRAFLKQCAIKGRENEASASELHRAYLTWAESENANAISAKALGTKLAAIGFERIKRGGVVRYRGVGLARLN